MSKPTSARLTQSDQKMINELLESKNFAKTFTRMINGNCKLALKAQRILDKDMDVAPGRFTAAQLTVILGVCCDKVTRMVKVMDSLSLSTNSGQEDAMEDAYQAALEIEKKKVH